MTTYNGVPLIFESIDSILSQTWRDFELIVVDDCSSNDTVSRLERYVDPRVRIIRNARNLGIVGSRNVGFSVARGRYLAALDHDDISLPQRLERQVAYLEAHPDVVLVGSKWLNLKQGVTHPDPYDMTEPLQVRWALYITNPMCYSSIMVRANCLSQLSPPMRQERVLADDFDLYHRLLIMGEIARLPERLILYRIHGNNTFQHRMKEMQDNAVLVLTDAYARWFGLQAKGVAELMTRLVASRQAARNDEELCSLRNYLEILARSFIEENAPPIPAAKAIQDSVDELWDLAVQRRIRAGGLSSIKHLRPMSEYSWKKKIYILQTVVFGLIPAKRILGKFTRSWVSRLPEKIDAPWFTNDGTTSNVSDYSSPAWERFTTWLTILFCFPLIVLISMQDLKRRLTQRLKNS